MILGDEEGPGSPGHLVRTGGDKAGLGVPVLAERGGREFSQEQL